jgi:hypothetical protein
LLGLGILAAAVSSQFPNSKTLTKSNNDAIFEDAVCLKVI